MLGLLEILQLKGLDTSKRIKLVRHTKSEKDKLDPYKLYLKGQLQLELYQSSQDKEYFKACDQIISFVGIENNKAQFIGVYDVFGCEEKPNFKWPDGFLYKDSPADKFIYDLRRDERFDFLVDRLVIEWFPNPRPFHRWIGKDKEIKDKEIVEILPHGYVRECPDYMDIILSYGELKKIIKNRDANLRWHQKLSAVAGIYLILDEKTGKQYIGSASGKDGILDRWRYYAATGHGDNKQLIELLKKQKNYADNFQFSILHTMSKSLTPLQIKNVEFQFMKKLGSRVHGLN